MPGTSDTVIQNNPFLSVLVGVTITAMKHHGQSDLGGQGLFQLTLPGDSHRGKSNSEREGTWRKALIGV